jgi:hypothetical protein
MSRGLAEPIMSGDESSGELIPAPKEGASPVWLGFSIAVNFYPPIRMTRKAGCEFTTQLSEHLEPENVHLDSDEWSIDGAGTYEGMEISVTKTRIRSFVKAPIHKLEWYEQRASAILRVFEQVFSPKIALGINVRMSALVDLAPDNADARFFLGAFVMLLDVNRLKVIDPEFPEILGLRLFFPESDKRDWSVDVRIESFGPDSSKVYLNSAADWEDQSEWDTGFADKAVERMTTVSQFMHGPLIEYLHHQPPSSESDEEE